MLIQKKGYTFFMKRNKTTEQTNLIDETPKERFIIVYESVYKNRFTSDEMHLLIKLISLAPTFKPTSRKLASILNIDIRALNQASKGLQKKGYLIIKKHGKNSQWIINQKPINSALKDLTKETLLNALLNFEIDIQKLKLLHKLKYIDDRLFIETATAYGKELQRIVKTKWLDED